MQSQSTPWRQDVEPLAAHYQPRTWRRGTSGHALSATHTAMEGVKPLAAHYRLSGMCGEAKGKLPRT